jgi:hypothetical protein
MKIALAVLALVIAWSVSLEIVDAFAQAPVAQPTLSAEAQSLLTQLHAVGCNAEENAAAQTIAQLQKQNADLKAEIQKLDPPKSGATKK